jgi:hypothetical protein
LSNLTDFLKKLQLSPQYLIFSRKLPKRIFKLLYDVAAEILQKAKNVVVAFMPILHLKKICARPHWLAVVSLTWLYCSLVYAVLRLQPFAW